MVLLLAEARDAVLVVGAVLVLAALLALGARAGVARATGAALVVGRAGLALASLADLARGALVGRTDHRPADLAAALALRALAVVVALDAPVVAADLAGLAVLVALAAGRLGLVAASLQGGGHREAEQERGGGDEERASHGRTLNARGPSSQFAGTIC